MVKCLTVSETTETGPAEKFLKDDGTNGINHALTDDEVVLAMRLPEMFKAFLNDDGTVVSTDN